MHHGEIAIRVAELLDRVGYLFLGEHPGSVTAQVHLVGKDSSLIRLVVDGQEYPVVISHRRPRRRCPCPIIFKLPA
jgi:hypothetical protein